MLRRDRNRQARECFCDPNVFSRPSSWGKKMKRIMIMLLGIATWGMVSESAEAQTDVVPCDILCWAKGHQPGGQALLCLRKIGSQKEADYWKQVNQTGWGVLQGIAVTSTDVGGNGLSCPEGDLDFHGTSYKLRTVPVAGSVYGANVCGADTTDPKVGSTIKVELCGAVNDGRETNFSPFQTSR